MPGLTDEDRHFIDRFLELADADDVCKYTGEADLDDAYARAFGRARELARELAVRLERVLGS